MVPRPVGRGRWTTIPAWMHARTIGGLQHQASSRAQQERNWASATVGTCPSRVPPLVERESMNAATQGPGVASSGPQQLTSRWSLPTTGGNAPPSPRTIGTRRDRAASCDRPSPRPTTRPRHRSPSPCGGNIVITPASLLPGILGRRQRSISPPAGTPVRPHQRLWFAFTENTQNQRALVPRRDNPAVQGRSPRPSENVPTLSEIVANGRAWSNRAEARVAGAQLVSVPPSGKWAWWETLPS